MARATRKEATRTAELVCSTHEQRSKKDCSQTNVEKLLVIFLLDCANKAFFLKKIYLALRLGLGLSDDIEDKLNKI